MLVLLSILIKLTAAIVATFLIGIVTYFKYAFKFWETWNVPYPTPYIPFGNFANPLNQKQSLGNQCAEYYKEYKSKGESHFGLFLFAKPIYIPISITYIKNIMTKDFQYFVDRGVYYNEEVDPLSANLFALEGTRWRNLRAKITPTFTTGKMKLMFEALNDCGLQLKSAMNKIALKNEALDIKDILARFTIDVIGSCAFGLQCNSFEQPDSDFRKYGSRIFRATGLEQLKNFVSFFAPNLARKLSFGMIPNESADFFLKIIKGTVGFREANNIERNDFVQLLIRLKNGSNFEENSEICEHDGKSITFEELAAQAFIFFIAGFDTSATALSFCFFELALNQDIQDTVRDEILRIVGTGDKITYESLAKMEYTTQVIEETLRKYSPVSTLHRVCIKDYAITGTNITIKQGTSVIIPVRGLHYDPEYFPNPDTFDPSRFNSENRSKIQPFTYLPFGEGPRNCIGSRFGIMQMKIALIIMLANYKFTINPKTKLPLVFNPYSFVLTTLDEIWLDVSRFPNH